MSNLENFKISTEKVEKQQKQKKPEDFRFALFKIWQDSFSENEIKNFKKQEEEEALLKKREQLIEGLDIFNLLKRYKIDISNIKQISNGLFKIKIFESYKDKKLPEAYAFKGGAARSLLLRVLGIDKNSMPRDFDLARVGVEPYEGADDEVAEKFMPQDFEYGDGVEVISSIKRYLNTRDFTLNELLATEHSIILTKACLLDTVRHIIRLSDYEKEEEIRSGELNEKLLAKGLRLYSAELLHYDAKFTSTIIFDLSKVYINKFWLALHLDRALEIGDDVAQKYVDILVQTEILPDNIKTVEDAAGFLIKFLYDFSFRYVQKDQWEIEHDLLLEKDLKYLNLNKKQSIHKR